MLKFKVCTTCKQELSFNDFNKSKGGKYGLKSVCRRCSKIYNKQHRSDNIEKYSQQCKIYKLENKEKILLYREQNKLRDTAKAKIYRKQNKAKINEHCKKYREENSIKIKETKRIYCKNNKDKCNALTNKRRALKQKLASTLTVAQWIKVKLYFNNKCCYCGRELPLEQEHFLSLSRGGEYTINNIVCACRSCNASKHDYDFSIWFSNYKYYSKEREKIILKYLHYENNMQQLSIF